MVRLKMATTEKLNKLLDEGAASLYGKAVCLIGKCEKIIFTKNINCSLDSIFDLASITKVLTATMIFKLIGEGKLSLDKKLIDLFNDKPIGEITRDRFKEISLQDLLTHSSGLPAWYPFYTQNDSFYNILEIVLEKYKPEEGTVYSDLGFMLLGEIICSITGRTLEENLDALNKELQTSFLFNPKAKAIPIETCVETERGNLIERGMCSSRDLTFDNFRSVEENMCAEVNDGNSFYFWKGVSGHAGIFGTAGDLIKLGSLYLNKGNLNEKLIIPPDLAEKSVLD
ncbi:MAG: serine hydrolase, partial [Treponema sp.]|nr:serine hydrolase [Treponema sp.]